MIYLGTSGWSYDDWVGPVYPENLSKGGWLSFIADQVDALEVNVTYYRLPDPRMVQGWVARTPEDFIFAVKAHRSLTHERKEPDFKAYREGLKPLIDSEKLGCILAQFPYSFHANDQNRDYLGQLRQGLQGLEVVIEFRNRGWVSDETFRLLSDLEFGYCAVDQPRFDNLMPPIIKATGKVGYVRFHGRNYEKWWNHDEAWERYNYDYSKDELQEWVPKLKQLAASTQVTMAFANNHWRGKSLETVRLLRELLQDS
jgi:uncharacterized protein YecE (DUF72 family)